MGQNIRGSSSSVRDQRRYYQEQAELQRNADARVSNLETAEKHVIRMVQLGSLFLNGVTLTSGVDYTPVVSPATAVGVANIQGVFANFWIDPTLVGRDIYFGSSDDTLTTASQRYRFLGGNDIDRQLMTQLVIVPVGTDGNIKIQATGAVTATAYMAIFGYWL